MCAETPFADRSRTIPISAASGSWRPLRRTGMDAIVTTVRFRPADFDGTAETMFRDHRLRCGSYRNDLPTFPVTAKAG